MSKNTGGPAFAAIASGPCGDVYDSPGITYLDYAAIAAMQGMMARDGYDEGQSTPEKRAKLAYIEARAMLAERDKP
jgi:hypothetical protein